MRGMDTWIYVFKCFHAWLACLSGDFSQNLSHNSSHSNTSACQLDHNWPYNERQPRAPCRDGMRSHQRSRIPQEVGWSRPVTDTATTVGSNHHFLLLKHAISRLTASFCLHWFLLSAPESWQLLASMLRLLHNCWKPWQFTLPVRVFLRPYSPRVLTPKNPIASRISQAALFIWLWGVSSHQKWWPADRCAKSPRSWNPSSAKQLWTGTLSSASGEELTNWRISSVLGESPGSSTCPRSDAGLGVPSWCTSCCSVRLPHTQVWGSFMSFLCSLSLFSNRETSLCHFFYPKKEVTRPGGLRCNMGNPHQGKHFLSFERTRIFIQSSRQLLLWGYSSGGQRFNINFMSFMSMWHTTKFYVSLVLCESGHLGSFSPFQVESISCCRDDLLWIVLPMRCNNLLFQKLLQHVQLHVCRCKSMRKPEMLNVITCQYNSFHASHSIKLICSHEAVSPAPAPTMQLADVLVGAHGSVHTCKTGGVVFRRKRSKTHGAKDGICPSDWM